MKEVDLDSTIDALETADAKENGQRPASRGQGKILVGTVEDFFGNIDVVAIKLVGSVKVGDIIEIGDPDDAVRQRVSSMQIDREDVYEAGEGDSVGIKLKYKVGLGRSVYKIE